jgi:stearoyl-CoA desaturase (Delta-9 desaturase)
MTVTVENIEPAQTEQAEQTERGTKPLLDGQRSASEHFAVKLFVIVPTLMLAAAVPFTWGWGLGWTDIGLALGFFVVSGIGVTVGYHRLFTHSSFKAKRGLRVALALSGSLADHRRHHAFSDKLGDPHSPWRFGSSPAALAKGFWYAHMGWLFTREHTNAERFAPDLLTDPDMRKVDRLFPLCTALTLLLPALLGGVITWSFAGALTAFIWAGLVRIAVLHHVTWSVNSICHMIGERPFKTRDKAANFWPLAILSFGEAWHNLHHADPTCARHGVLRGQIDISARLIWMFEKLGWAWDVRWPTRRRLDRMTA